MNPGLCSGSGEFASPAPQLDGSLALWAETLAPTAPLTSGLSSLQSNRKENQGGHLCNSCAEQRVGPLAFLAASPERVRAMQRTVETVVLPRHEALLFLVF